MKTFHCTVNGKAGFGRNVARQGKSLKVIAYEAGQPLSETVSLVGRGNFSKR